MIDLLDNDEVNFDIETTACVCGNTIFLAAVMFDETGVVGYYSKIQCSDRECNLTYRAPMPMKDDLDG